MWCLAFSPCLLPLFFSLRRRRRRQSICLRLGIYDTQCGAKLFRSSDTLRQVVQTPFCSKWVFDVEIIARYQKSRRTSPEQEKVHNVLFEFPLMEWEDVAGSKLSVKDIFGFVSGLCFIFWNYTLARSQRAPPVGQQQRKDTTKDE